MVAEIPTPEQIAEIRFRWGEGDHRAELTELLQTTVDDIDFLCGGIDALRERVEYNERVVIPALISNVRALKSDAYFASSYE